MGKLNLCKNLIKLDLFKQKTKLTFSDGAELEIYFCAEKKQSRDYSTLNFSDK